MHGSVVIAWTFAAGALAAEPCPRVEAEITAAWAAFADAELDVAAAHLATATAARVCQPGPVDPDQLRELYLLDATTSLARGAAGDEEHAEAAIIDAVTAFGAVNVDARYGPEVERLAALWATRLVGTRAAVVIAGPGPLHVDGVAHTGRWEGIAGAHLLQWPTPDGGWHGEVRELVGTTTVRVAPDAPTPQATRRRLPGIPAVWGLGLATAALGGGLVIGGYVLEEQFIADPYADPSYGDCTVDERCYARARREAIDRDVATIRGMYASGYAVMGVGGAMTVVGLAVPPPRRAGAAVTVTVPWPLPARARRP